MRLEEFLHGELDSVLRYARVLTGERATAEDIVQDVVEKLWRRPELFDTMAEPQAYVRRMITNQYLSWGRRWFRVQPRAVIESPEPVRDASQALADRAELDAGLAGLTRNQRAVLVMRYFLDLPDDQIAATLGCGVGTVRTHASRGLAELRILLPLRDRSTP